MKSCEFIPFDPVLWLRTQEPMISVQHLDLPCLPRPWQELPVVPPPAECSPSSSGSRTDFAGKPC